MKLKIFEAFSGYGSQAMALERLKKEYSDFDYEVVGISEIDRYAIQAYNAVHGETTNYGDISKIDWDNVPDFDLFTMSSPCQDFSSAGLQKGGAEGSGTRSSLLWECRRAILAKKPKYILFENVKALTSKKFLPYLLKWQDELSSYGYTNFTKVLNAKNYGVPQNRERVFMISVLGDAWYEFPEPFALDKRLKDILEKDVDEKYYLSVKILNTFQRRNEVNESRRGVFGISVNPMGRKLEFRGDKSIKDISPTLRATDFKCPHTAWENSKEGGYRIRKLTPRECFRLMGVSDSDIDKIQSAGISKTQQYKLAGNSIVVDVLYYIFANLFINKVSNE